MFRHYVIHYEIMHYTLKLLPAFVLFLSPRISYFFLAFPCSITGATVFFFLTENGAAAQ